MTWWDYSEEPLNIGGYVCLKFSLAWGVAGIMLMRVIHPLVNDFIMLIPAVLLNICLTMFYCILITDLVITIIAVLKLNRDLKEITRLSELLRKSSDKMAEGIGNTALLAMDKIQNSEITGKTREISEHIQLTAKENREKLQAWKENFEKHNTLLNNAGIVRMRLLRAFPRMKNVLHSNALSDMKQRLEKRLKKAVKKETKK